MPGGPSPWPVFWIAGAAVFLVALDITMLYVAFDPLRKAFPQAGTADLSWVLNAYTVVYAAMLIPAGGLADRHGHKRVFLIGVTVFLAASAACGAATSVGWLIAARVLQAAGAALLIPASLALILAAFPLDRRAVAVSLWGALSGLAGALGPTLGALVIDSLGWRWAFFLNLPVGAYSLWRGWHHLRESAAPQTARRVDAVGMLLLILAVGSITLAIVQSESPAWSRDDLLRVLGLGALATIAFVAWARFRVEPLIDLSLFRYPAFTFVNLATLAFGIAFSMMFFGFFFFLTEIWRYSLPRAGLAITIGPLVMMPAAVVTGRLAARLGHRPFLTGGALVFCAGALWLWRVPGPQPEFLIAWLPGMLITGIGVGMVMPSLSGAAVARLPAAHYAVGSAVNQTTRQIGSVLGVAITVLLLGRAGLAQADFTPHYLIYIGLGLLTGLLCLPVNTRPTN